ncbi:MAG: PilW family protein [Candidatus Methylomirabilales bacterium]
MRSFSSIRLDQRGFTLVELLVALAIVGLIMAGVVHLYMTSSKIHAGGVGRVGAQQAARAVMVMMGEDLLLAGYGYPTAPKITAATPTSVTFWADLTQVAQPKAITYSWDAGTETISKDAGDGAGPQLLAAGVQAFQLRYFDTTDVEIPAASLPANLENIRRLTITMTAEAPGQNPPIFTLTSDVRPRNL